MSSTKKEEAVLRSYIQQAFQHLGIQDEILLIRSISGGSINDCYHVQTRKQDYFLKINHDMPADFFQKESMGLRLIRESQTLAVPQIYGLWQGEYVIVLVMEWIAGQKTADTERKLGEGLARLHQTYGQKFGLGEDNYIGSLPQPNGWYEHWPTFYKERRLKVQIELGIKKGTIRHNRRKKCEQLLEQLPKWLNHPAKPSLIHGDLWSGNWIVGSPNGTPYLIDPAVCYADREMDLAFTELFGGFSEAFYQAYDQVYPRLPGYEERKGLYQLYYLLVHLNLFGETYGPSVDHILMEYVT